MTHPRTLLAAALMAALLPACSDRSPVGVEPGSEPHVMAQASTAAAQSVPDLGGAWNWSNAEVLRMPRWFVEAVGPVLGVTPEGENTHARCVSEGTMTLTQTGTEFHGVASRTSNSCETTGGQVFQQLEGDLFVADGRINGQAARFSLHSATVKPCPHHAVISGSPAGAATTLDGGGRCRLPGHPQSESPFAVDPPPGGTSTTLNWQAWRP